MTIALLAAFFFILLNIFFVLAEFSLVRTAPARLEVMQAEGNTRAALVLKMVRRLDQYLSAIQIGVTICTLGLGWLGEPAVSGYLIGALERVAGEIPNQQIVATLVSFLIIMYFQIVFAELVPRNVAIHKAEDIALFIAYPLELYKRLIQAPNWVLARSASLFSRALGFAPAGEVEQVYTEDEVRVMLGTSQEKGLMPLDRLLLIENLFDLSELKVRDAMVPREKIVYLSASKSWEENRAVISKSHFSRLPYADPDIDHITGIVHVKDLLNTGAEPKLADIKRRVSTVQDSEPLQPLLKSMTAQGKHMMIAVRGERVSGLITLEDVLEEIVGEIHDEFDAPMAWSLHALLQPELVDLDLRASTPRESVESLAGRVRQVHGLDPRPIIQAVLDRESQLPTAIGNGVAVPHARLADLPKPIVAVGRSARPVSFSAPDKVAVRLIFLILTPASAPLEQLRILGRIATVINNETLRRGLMRAKSAGHFTEIVRTSEAIVAG